MKKIENSLSYIIFSDLNVVWKSKKFDSDCGWYLHKFSNTISYAI